MIVVDTNVIGYLFLTSSHSSRAEKAFYKDPEWAAPILWRSEMRNVLALYMRKNIIKLEYAQQIMNTALVLLKGREYEAPSNEVLRLASESQCAAYDCEFVAIAKDLKVPMITEDKRLLQAFPQIAMSLEQYCRHG
jgi:predicted nucleic acid-binding protein